MFKLFKKNHKAFNAPVITAVNSADVLDFVHSKFEDDFNVGISDDGDELLRAYASHIANIPENIELHFCSICPAEYATNLKK